MNTTPPIPPRKPDITGNDISWSDRLFNAATGVFEAVSQIELQRYQAERLGFQSQEREQAALQQTQEYAGTWENPYQPQNNMTFVYAAAAALVGVGLVLAIK